MAFSDIHKDGRVILSVHSMSEQHQKALSAAGRFNPLNRQTGISPDSVLPSWTGLLTLAPMIRNAPADTH